MSLHNLKVAHFFKAALPESIGGVEDTIATLSDSLASLNIQTEVFATSRNKEFSTNYRGHQVHYFRAWLRPFSTPISLRYLIEGIKKINEFDIVYVHHPYPLGEAASLFFRRRSRLIVYYHSDVVDKPLLLLLLYKPLIHLILRRAQCILSTSQNYCDSSTTLTKFSDKLAVIPSGVEDLSRVKKIKPNFFFDFSKPFFVFVGVFRAYKGLRDLLESCKHFSGNVLIIGEGGEIADLLAYAEENHIINVSFAGRLDNEQKAYCLSKAAGLVLPSNKRAEALGISLIEGLAMGLPLVCCDLGTGTTAVNIHNETGFIVEPNSPKQLAKAMNKILECENTRKKFSKNARRRYLECFSIEQMKQKHIALIDHLISAQQRDPV